VAEVLVGAGAEVDAVTVGGFTALHTACHYGHIKVAKVLVKGGASVTKVAANGNTPIKEASSEGHQKVVTYLTTWLTRCSPRNPRL
jgi:ankyrin repeat protein